MTYTHEQMGWSPGDPWCCTRDGVTEPCGDCDGCRWMVGCHLVQIGLDGAAAFAVLADAAENARL